MVHCPTWTKANNGLTKFHSCRAPSYQPCTTLRQPEGSPRFDAEKPSRAGTDSSVTITSSPSSLCSPCVQRRRAQHVSSSHVRSSGDFSLRRAAVRGDLRISTRDNIPVSWRDLSWERIKLAWELTPWFPYFLSEPVHAHTWVYLYMRKKEKDNVKNFFNLGFLFKIKPWCWEILELFFKSYIWWTV